jgi:ribosomal protein S21
MLIVKVYKNDIEKSLKDLKSKVIKTRQNSRLNELREYKKKSVLKRQILNNAKYTQKKFK